MELTPIQKDWLAALRSGEYKQCSDMLQNGDSFCCLGVACVIAEKHGVLVEYGVVGDDRFVLGESLEVQDYVRNALNLRDPLGTPEGGGKACSLTLTVLNDTGASFEEIADIIENHPESYFYDPKGE